MNAGASSDKKPMYSSPEDQGMDSVTLGDLISYIQKNKITIRSVLVSRNDNIVLETYFHPFSREDRTLAASVTKSIISALVGIAVDNGFIKDIDQKIGGFFPEFTFLREETKKQDITIRHLLTMSSGLQWDDGEDQAEMMTRSDCAEYVLSRPLVEKPGVVFNYNSGGAHILSVLLTRATGMNTRKFAEKYLFAPLGITDFDWKPAPDGVAAGGNLIFLRPQDMLTFGLLYLHRGEWNGRQLIPSHWVAESTKNRIKPPWDREDETLGYGYLWWNAAGKNKPPYFSADGYGGQIIAVMPEKNLVTVITAHLTEPDLMGIPYSLLGRFIIPALQSDTALPVNRAASDELARLCRRTEKPEGIAPPTMPQTASIISGNTYVFAANPSKLQSLLLRFTGTGEAVLTLAYADTAVNIPVGLDNRYRTCRVPRLVEKTEYFHDFIAETVGFKGEWENNSTFVISMAPINLSVFIYFMKLEFNNDRVHLSVFRKEFPELDLDIVGVSVKQG
jgi:CubicO group peptidase (beta-lactamase class C family)